MSAFEHLLTGWDGQQVAVRLRGLGDTLRALYTEDGGSPVHAAEALVARRRRAA